MSVQDIHVLENTNSSVDIKDEILVMSTYYGGSPQYHPNMPKPPSGKKVINGYVEYHGTPAIGVSIKLMLNGEYLTRLCSHE